MALDISIWLIVLVAGFLGYFLGMSFRIPFVFLFGSILMGLSGALIYIFDGLLLDRVVDSVSASGVVAYNDIVILSSNIGLNLLALVLIAIPIISFLVIDFKQGYNMQKSPFHY